MFTNYADCEIEFHPREDNSYSLALRSPGGDADGVLHLPTGDPAYQELAENLKHLQTDEAIIMRIGQMLFGALFQGKIKERYTFSQGTLQAGQGLRLVLNIGADEQEAGALPWEFLYDPDQAGPMTLLDMPIVRYLPQPLRIPILKTDLPLKVLLTGAQTPAPLNAIPVGARDQTPENITRELAEVHAALAGMGDHVRIEVEEHITTGKLQKLLRQGFHVWHFVGHGSVNANGTAGRLQFEDGAGGTSPVSAQQLGILLNRSVRLVVLNSCQSGQLALNPFRSMAPALIRAQIPAVVAMQFSVPQHSARAFAVEFYRALAEGFPIDACVTEGRKAVMNEVGLDRADWGIPVVYTRAEDGRLFDLPPTPLSRLIHTVEPEPQITTSIGNRNIPETQEQGDEIGQIIGERMSNMDQAPYKQLQPLELRKKLRQFISDYFDDSALRDLYFDLGVNYEDRSGQNRADKIRELILHCERQHLIDDLAATLSQLQPRRWSETFGGATPPVAATTQTEVSPPVPAQNQETQANAEKRVQLQERIQSLKQQLHALQLQAAQFGMLTPVHISIEIERLHGKRDERDQFVRTSDGRILKEGEIARLERELSELGR